MTKLRFAVAAVVSFLLALPIGGFVFGFVHCKDCARGDLLGRALIGAVFAVLTPLSFGFPPQNEGGVGEPWNAWPHIVGSALVLFAFLAMLLCRTQRNKR